MRGLRSIVRNLNMDKKTKKGQKPKPPPSYIDGADLPSSGEEEDDEVSNTAPLPKQTRRSAPKPLDTTTTKISDKKSKQRAKKYAIATHAADVAKQETLNDDRDAFTVAISTRPDSDDDSASANVKDITIDNFSVSARGKQLLRNASLKITHGRKYGLVGPNGTGKSTLLKLLAWRKIPVPKNIDTLLVEQEVAGADDTTAVEAVVSADENLVKLRRELLVATDENLSEIYDKLHLIGSDSAEARASKILAGLGFTKEMLSSRRSTNSFSGGWRMRVSLARALFVKPTLLLLDEPTNHLDLRAVLWLEEYLSRWKNTLVVVSHDRGFLNSVCDEIIHLHDLDLRLYRGSFDEFESGFEQRKNKAKKEFEIHNKQTKKKWRDYTVEFRFPEPNELAPPLLQLVEVGFGYPDRTYFRLSGVDVGVDMRTRVAIVGPNGAGKSTLLNLLAGELEPTEGEVRRSRKLRVGRYSQHFVDQLTMEETPVEYLLRKFPEQEGCSKQEAVRARLGKFGLSSHCHLSPIAKLSGGQKARVVFASIYMSKPHVLLLDEPTNHLDMESIDALGEALEEFAGGVVLVSHDSRLISRVCEDEERSEIWVVEGGTVEKFPGSFEEYKEELVEEIRAEVDG